jgi:hypothetical protein
MDSEQYNIVVKAHVQSAIEHLREAARLMRENGDNVRSQDLDEAIDYAEGAIEEV